MKRPINHRTLWLILAFFILLWGASAAIAKGSSHAGSSSDGGGPVSFEDYPRVMTFWPSRNAISIEGFLLVCPEVYKTGHNGECEDKKTDANMWQRVEWIAPAGMKVLRYEHRFVGSGGARILLVYFGPSKAATPAAPTQLELKPTLNFTGPITIQADKVIVQRKRVVPKPAVPASAPK